MPKMKSHKGLLKRVRVTAKGKVKFRKSKSGHLLSHKRGEKLQDLRKATCAKRADMRRLSKMLHRNLTPAD